MYKLIVANGNPPSNEVGSDQNGEEEELEVEGGGGMKLKHQSVLQTKLTKLAIQIGYAGRDLATQVGARTSGP